MGQFRIVGSSLSILLGCISSILQLYSGFYHLPMQTIVTNSASSNSVPLKVGNHNILHIYNLCLQSYCHSSFYVFVDSSAIGTSCISLKIYEAGLLFYLCWVKRINVVNVWYLYEAPQHTSFQLGLLIFLVVNHSHLCFAI